MANKQPFRSIQMRGQQPTETVNLRASDQTQALRAVADREAKKLQASHDARQNARRFQNLNAQIVDQQAIEQQRLQAQQLSTNQELAYEATNLLAKTRLENERTARQQSDQIRKMRNAQEIVRNQLELQQQSQQASSLSDFGEQLLNFSGTLWKQKADAINKANLRLQAQGQLDASLGRYADGDKTLDIAQNSRVSAGLRIDNEARELDRQGLYADATNLRSQNGFYVYGVQEGLAIKNARELHGYLQAAKEEAINAEVLNFGEPNADMKLQVFLQDKTIDFMVERGLTSLSPEIQQKYLAEAIIKSQLNVVTEFNEANQAFVKEQSVGLIRAQFRLAMNSDRYLEDGPMHLRALYGKDATNFAENLNDISKDAQAYALETGDLTALDQLKTMITNSFDFEVLAGDVLRDISKFTVTFEENQAKAANQAMEDAAEEFEAEWKLKAQTLTTAESLNEHRASGLEHINSADLPVKIKADLVDTLLNFGIQDSKVVANSNDEFLSDPNVTPEDIDARLDMFPQMPVEQRDRLVARRDDMLEQAEKDPKLQPTIDEALASIELTAPVIDGAELHQNPRLKDQINEAIELRQDQLKALIFNWRLDGEGEKTSRTLKDFLQDSAEAKRLLERPIETERVNMTTRVKGLAFDYGDYTTGSQIPTAETPTERPLKYTNGRQATFYTSPETRLLVLSGIFGDIDSRNGVFLTRPEVQQMVADYESTGQVDDVLSGLSNRAGQTPRQFLQDQAQLLGMPGTVGEPIEDRTLPLSRSGHVSASDARSYARKKGLSNKGAIWFAHVMMAESAGNPTVTHDQGTGYGLFAMRLSRRDALFAFAEARGKDKSDPQVQMDFALNELKTSYGSIWSIITSSNPTNSQLIKAQQDWMRFAEEHRAQRARNLLNELNSY